MRGQLISSSVARIDNINSENDLLLIARRPRASAFHKTYLGKLWRYLRRTAWITFCLFLLRLFLSQPSFRVKIPSCTMQ